MSFKDYRLRAHVALVSQITGASGFIASHIIKDLLDEGKKVRGTVRRYVSLLHPNRFH